jgi:conjugal transfer pilus assembly protein TraK
MSNRSKILLLILSVLPVTAALADEIEVPATNSLPIISLRAKASTEDTPAVVAGDSQRSAITELSVEPKHGKKKLAIKMPTPATSRDTGESKASKVLPGMMMEPPISVLPETTTTVKLSSSDTNRFICPVGEVKEVITSDEKGLMTKNTGKDVYVKFKVIKHGDGSLSYSTTPTELYVVCGGNTYSMIVFPERMPAQTIKLSSGKTDIIRENQALYSGLPFEKRIMRAIKEIYTDTMPDSYFVTKVNKTDLSWKGLVITLKKEVDIEGEGMHIKEYQVSLKGGQNEPFKMSEKMFLKKDFSMNPVAVSVDKHTLRPGETSRVFIVEQRQEKQLGGNGLMLPTLDGSAPATQGIAPSQNGTQPQAKPPMLMPSNTNGRTAGSTSFTSSGQAGQ